MQRNLFLCILAACLLLISPAAASYTNEMNEWIDTGGQGRYWSWGATSGTTPVDVLHFSDITRASTLNYVALDVPSAVGSWSEGSHPMSYTIGGETRDGVFYVSYSRNALGSITGTRFILFFYDWNIGSLMGAQDVQITPILYNASRLYYSYMYGEDGDHYVRFQGSTGGQIHTGGDTVNGVYFGPRHTVTVSSGIDWANRITISDNYGGSDLNVALQREYGTKAHGSTLDIRSPTGSLYSSFGTTDASLLYPADNVVMINVTSPSGQIYSYPQSLYTPEEPEYTPTLYGEVIDIYTGNPISGATITATQAATGRTFSTTSDASGKYTISPGPVAGYPITISASAAGYENTGLNFAEVPRWSSWYVPLYMFTSSSPEIPTDPEKSMLYGYVITQGSQQPIQGASVTLSGVGSTTTSSTGFYLFNNVTADTYTISASAPYHSTVSESVSVGASATQHNLALEGTHSLTVTVKDASDLTL
ncbi:MAG: carboxypeptidase-like regulatory domain-containing protein, partial [Bacilli bacterium]